MKDIKVYDNDGKQVTALVQWDRDVYLNMTGTYITAAHNVHFFNCQSSYALVVESTYDNGTLTVKVPNDLLEESHPICGYVYIQDDEWCSTYGFTVQVIKRPPPE